MLRPEVIATNDLAQHVLRSIYAMDSHYNVNLEARFRERDQFNTGAINKVDFLQILETNVRDL